jgi:hypothetical protein
MISEGEDLVSEGRDLVELLNHRVHVADAAKVAQAREVVAADV